MFSKGKHSEPAPAPAPAPQAPAPKPRDRSGMRSSVPSIISGDLVVRGTLVSNGDVQIDGRIEGDVRAGALVIGEKAHIEGDVYAEDAIVRGSVHGAISQVFVGGKCLVNGRHPRREEIERRYAIVARRLGNPNTGIVFPDYVPMFRGITR